MLRKGSFIEALVFLGLAVLSIAAGLVLGGVAVAVWPNPAWGGLFWLLGIGALVLIIVGVSLLVILRPWQILGRRGVGFAGVVGGGFVLATSSSILVRSPQLVTFAGGGLALGLASLLGGLLLWQPWQGPLLNADAQQVSNFVLGYWFFTTGIAILAVDSLNDLIANLVIRDPSISGIGITGAALVGLGLLLRRLLPVPPAFFASLLPARPGPRDRRWLLGVVGVVAGGAVLTGYLGLRFGWLPARAIDLGALLVVLAIQVRALRVERRRAVGA